MPNMVDDEDIWELRKGDVLIGQLYVIHQGDFWFTARLSATNEFKPYREIFSEGYFYDNKPKPDKEWWEKWIDRINRLEMHLIRLSDQRIPSEFILHVKNDRADFRVFWD
jgi:hypothetical protein